MLDQNQNYITSAYKQISSSAKETGADIPHQNLKINPITITKPGYVYIYLSNETGSRIEVFFDDFKVSHENSLIVQKDDYYPFGMSFNSYTRPGSVGQKFLYNGKELQEETGWLNYGARMYMPELGRWTSVDILADAYVDFSPYAYVLNNPLKFVDPDGKKVLYVNGYWQDTWLGKNVIGSSKPGRGYWGNGFVRGASKFFNDGQRGNGMFIDGSSQWGGDESGSERYTRGYEYAKKHYDELIADMRQDETFKLVTHSEGGAYGAGIAQYLIDQGKTVGTILHLSPDEADEFDNPENTTTYQLGYGGDWVTGNKEVSNADVFGVVDKFSSNSDKAKYAHGSTKGGGVFKSVNALLKAAASGATGVNVTETSSGVRFEFIRKNEDEDKNK
ncbi:RHS repeat-associated core domain-containing protein [Echinicola pacifica]|uniref:RHS repeat-associated core domain-containing protein n=1 Tax=Echinicola pacifica TaxID=346377 RepID=UPI001E53DC43|nr:RHS repeat-associated core domain-containing protein [Echinicola pacifica]